MALRRCPTGGYGMTEYNYFRYAGTRKLLLLLGIDKPTREQMTLAEGFMEDVVGLARSKIGM
jgi:hypothetical protein